MMFASPRLSFAVFDSSSLRDESVEEIELYTLGGKRNANAGGKRRRCSSHPASLSFSLELEPEFFFLTSNCFLGRRRFIFLGSCTLRVSNRKANHPSLVRTSLKGFSLLLQLRSQRNRASDVSSTCRRRRLGALGLLQLLLADAALDHRQRRQRRCEGR